MQVVFFDSKIIGFIQKLPKNIHIRTARSIRLLQEHGHTLGPPNSKSIGNGMFELRIRSVIQVRFIYMYYSSTVIILHGFIKKTRKIPRKELAIARKNKHAFESK